MIQGVVEFRDSAFWTYFPIQLLTCINQNLQTFAYRADLLILHGPLDVGPP